MIREWRQGAEDVPGGAHPSGEGRGARWREIDSGAVRWAKGAEPEQARANTVLWPRLEDNLRVPVGTDSRRERGGNRRPLNLGQARRTRYAGLAPYVAWRPIVVMDTYVLWRMASLPLDGRGHRRHPRRSP